MKNTRIPLLLSVMLLGGCAGIQFSSGTDHGLTYFDPVPHLFVTRTQDPKTSICTVSATVIMIPGEKKQMKFKWGYGVSDLTVNLSNGMITSVNQKNDSKIPETINAFAGLAGTALGAAKTLQRERAGDGKPPETKQICTPPAALYKLDKGEVTNDEPFTFGIPK